MNEKNLNINSEAVKFILQVLHNTGSPLEPQALKLREKAFAHNIPAFCTVLNEGQFILNLLPMMQALLMKPKSTPNVLITLSIVILTYS
jgi:hypothetical protein